MAARVTKNPSNVMMATLTRQIRPQLSSLAKERFESAKQWLLLAVKQHPISQDIESHSSSHYLGAASGSLFGFLGFESGSHPVDDLVSFLRDKIRMSESKARAKSLLSFTIYFPGKSEMSSSGLLLPWQDQPWPLAIESGISGLPYFLNKVWSGSRSGEGIQIENRVRSSDFRPQPYLTPLISEFRKKLLLK